MNRTYQGIINEIHRLGFSVKITESPSRVEFHAICRSTGEEFFSRADRGNERKAAHDLRELIDARAAHPRRGRERTSK